MLATNKKISMLGAVALIVGGLAYARAADTAKTNATSDVEALVGAAEKVYGNLIMRFRNGEPVKLDELNLWSRRVVDAISRAKPSARLDALQAHEMRMQDVHDTWNRLMRAGLAFETSKTDYYVLEAKILVSDARSANP
ncbi:MAG TPA: hypothetical protein VHY91_14000 [Pirellulales bacterium]|jgi:hypothetical protein|nr:hypothetical protein [Pirellulales bacterium]